MEQIFKNKTMKKEEQKQHLIDKSKYISGIDPYDKQETNLKKHLNSCQEYQGPRRSAVVDKQETLEEAAENKYGLSDQYWKDRIGFVHGAKWQAERMYSEEDMEEAFENGLKRSFDSDFDRWFEQFKKK
jgi:hypothetical protein